MKKENYEKYIITQIETINDMLSAVCDELNNYNEIDEYEIELNETSYKTCIDEREQKHYKILVTCKRSLKEE